MLILSTKEFFFIRKKEIWFYREGLIEPASYTSYCYAENIPTVKPDNELTEFTTTIDLTRNENELWNSVNSTFRYHIRKAQRLNFELTLNSDPAKTEINSILKRFRPFASRKKIHPINSKRIFELKRLNRLIVTTVSGQNGVIATHIYLHDSERVLLMHTFHEDLKELTRNQGYANKYLHWNDILFFKRQGFKCYDFGGIDEMNLPGISTFKLSFGGTKRQVNSYTMIHPRLKPLFNFYKKILKR